MSYRFLTFVFLLVILPGCAQFTDFDRMGTEEQSFSYNTSDEDDMLVGDRPADKHIPGPERFLYSELKRLEASEHPEDMALYREHRDRLKTVSEKIYFLKLSPFDRRDYLVSRGFISEREAMAQRMPAEAFRVRKDEVALGMRKPDVLDSLGKPLRVEIAGNPKHENERWLYRLNGAPKYIYFEAGEVQGWE